MIASRSAASLFALVFTIYCAHAHAQPLLRAVDFDIASQRLAPAIIQFSEQAHVQVISSGIDVTDQTTPGVIGRYTVADALNALLKGTGLRYKAMNENTVSLQAIKPSPGSGQTQSAQSSTLALAQGEPTPNSSLTSADTPSASTSGPADAEKFKLGEIIVTAQKRSELLSKAPVAVTALDMSQLQDAGVIDIRNLTSAVPDVQIHTVGVDSFVGINIRGISNYDYTGSADPAVSTYVDGVYVGLSQGFASELYDLERIEVLRGPQGTLYGRNATGGNVNIVTATPKPEFSAGADVSYGNYNDVQTHGMVNVPLSDEFFVRAAFMTHRNDGYFNTRGNTVRNYAAADDFGGRATALWTPSAAFKWRLSVDEFVSEGTPTASIETGANGKPLNGLPVYEQPTSSDPEPDSYIQSTAVRSRIDWNFTDSLTASYVAGYQGLNYHHAYATTGELSAPANPGFGEYIRWNANAQSHELNVSYDTAALKNVFGGSYYHQDGPTTDSFVGVYDAFGLYGGGVQVNPGVRKEAWGVFEQATYSVLDGFRVTGGVRYSDERQRVNQWNIFYCPMSADPGLTVLQAGGLTVSSSGCFPATSPAGAGSWSSVSWKAGLEKDLTDQALTYASVTTGFKSGGLQVNVVPGIPPTFQPEKVTNYELGLKTRFLDDSANFRAAAFYADYRDLQVSQLMSLGVATTNAGKAGIYGIELESEWNVTPSDHLRGFANYLHATYLDYKNAVDSLTSVTVPSLDGSQLPNAPQESFRLQYSHDLTLPNRSRLTPQAAVYWQSVSYLSPFNDPYYRIAAYSKTDLNLTYTDPSDHWSVVAYVDNLENKAVRTGEFTSAGAVYSDFAPPRLVGLRVSYRP